MKKLAKKLLEEKRQKAAEMTGEKFEVQISKKAISIDEKNHTAIFIMSTSSIDRHGDIVDQESWNTKWFEENPMFFLQHKSNDFPIGKWNKIWFEDDPDNPGEKMLVGEAKFSVDIDENAKRAWDHLVAGNMGSVSVGFIPHRVEYDEEKDAFILYDCELLECSFVGVGSNRQATLKKGTDIDKEKEAILEKQNLDNLTNVKNNIDKFIKICKTERVQQHLKARADLNKAIRRLKKVN